MNPETLRQQWAEKSLDASQKRGLQEQAKNLEGIQGDVFNDFKEFFASLIPPQDEASGSSYQEQEIVLGRDRDPSPDIGEGVIVARLTSRNRTQDATHYAHAKSFVVEYDFVPDGKEGLRYSASKTPEHFAEGELRDKDNRLRTLPWQVPGASELEKKSANDLQGLVTRMRSQIEPVGGISLRQTADETLKMLRDAARDPDLNHDMAFRLREAERQTAIPEAVPNA